MPNSSKAPAAPEAPLARKEPRLSIIDGPPLSEEEGIGALTFGGFLAELAEIHGDREALRWNGESWTYTDLYNESERVARSLLVYGVTRGTRVGVLISNRPEWLFAVFGAAMTGAVSVALNTFSTRPELEYQLKHADISTLILEASVASKNFVDDISALVPELATTQPGELIIESLPFLRRVVCVDNDAVTAGMQRWDDFLAAGEAVGPEIVRATMAAISPVDQAVIFFSSGSTALPKAIQQTHRAAMLQCWRFGKWWEVGKDVRAWSANGFFFSGNFAMALGGTLSVGGCLILQKYFDPDEALALFEKEQVSQPMAWPHQEARLMECPAWVSTDLSSVKYISVESPMASHPTINTTWRQCNGYGMTETFTFVTGVAVSENEEGSHGFVLPGNSLRIVDPDTGQPVPYGQSGEIIIKGPTLTSGYLKVPPEETFDGEGFIHTQDAGHFTESGQLYWEGRLGDIIKTGGANVSPAEIDAVLVEHPSIQTVMTVGVPHDTLGEIVVSCVVLRDGMSLTEDELKQFGKQSLASYKVPRRVLFFREEELPKTGSNKIRRAGLKDLALERL